MARAIRSALFCATVTAAALAVNPDTSREWRPDSTGGLERCAPSVSRVPGPALQLAATPRARAAIGLQAEVGQLTNATPPPGVTHILLVNVVRDSLRAAYRRCHPVDRSESRRRAFRRTVLAAVSDHAGITAMSPPPHHQDGIGIYLDT